MRPSYNVSYGGKTICSVPSPVPIQGCSTKIRQVSRRIDARFPLDTSMAFILENLCVISFTPNQDTGDFVVIINAAKVRLTGSKPESKLYYRHTGWPGGIRTTAAGKMLEAKPERLLEIAVKGMLPKNRLGHQLFTKLKVYRGAEHPHTAQKPQVVTV